MKKFFLCSLLALGVIACTHDFVEPQTPQEAEELTLLTRSDDGSTTPSNGDGIVLGQKLNNPYSVENMNNTVQGLYGPVDFFDPTHYYVRFLPQDSLDYNILLSDPNLILFDYPLDYEITQYGDYYHDPSIPEDEITWQYTVVPVNYQFPQMQYEILEECYIPYDDFEPSDLGADMNSINSNTSINSVSGVNSNTAINIDFEELERQAFINSGNGDMLLPQQPLTRANKATPWGSVYIYDDSNNSMIPLRGAMITTRVFIKIGHSITNEYGEFEINKAYSARPEYVIRFTNSNVKIVRLLGETKKELGKYDASPKCIGVFADRTQQANISSSIFDISVVDYRTWTAGTIMNAASNYRDYCELLGVTAPYGQTRILLTDVLDLLDVEACGAPMLSQGTVNFLENLNMLRRYLFNNGQELAAIGLGFVSALTTMLPDIYVPLKEDQQTSDITSSIFHEMAHASHFSNVTPEYWAKYIDEIIFNWVNGYETNYGTPDNSPYCGVGEMWAGYFEEYLMRLYEEQPYYEWDDERDNLNIGWIRPQVFLKLGSLLNISPSDFFLSVCPFAGDVNSIDKVEENLIWIYEYFYSTLGVPTIHFTFGSYYDELNLVYKFVNTSPMARYLKFKYKNSNELITKFVDCYSEVDVFSIPQMHLQDLNSISPILQDTLQFMAVYDTNVMNMPLVEYHPNDNFYTNHFFKEDSWTLSIDSLNKRYEYIYETDY